MLNRSLDQIELAPELGLDDGTAIGLGLANAANMLAGSDAASKIVILLTDGVNNSGQIDPMTAAEAAKALGIKVYTIGAGKTGQVPVPVKSMFGTEQIMYQESQIDEATLQQIADITGGQFFRAEDSDTLGQIYDEITNWRNRKSKFRFSTSMKKSSLDSAAGVNAHRAGTDFAPDIIQDDTVEEGSQNDFAQPIYLTLLAMLPAAMLFLKWADRRRKTAIAWLGDQAVINRLLRTSTGADANSVPASGSPPSPCSSSRWPVPNGAAPYSRSNRKVCK